MLVALPLAIALVTALAWRHAYGPGGKRGVIAVAALALGVRLAGTIAMYLVARESHATGVFWNDEASFFLATESLLPDPLARALPIGLQHLGGDGYLGLTTALAMVGGVADANAFRVVNAALGACVAVITALLGGRLFGARAGLVAGLAAAAWPDLILWSSAFLRDTLGSLAVVGVWWALTTASRERWLGVACFLFLALALLATLREYLAIAVAVGIAAWLAYPVVRRQPARALLASALGLVALGLAVGVLGARSIDAATHALVYRQTVTRMETLGRLYRDPPPLEQPIQLPFRPGAAIALPDPKTGWLLAGLVVDSSQPGFVSVSLTDGTERTVPTSDLVLLQDARIPPLQLVSWTVPSMASVFVGLPDTNEDPNPGWIGAALAWDGLLLVALLGLWRSRLSPRHWLLPLCVTLGTLAALIAIPGAPGNAERHRATQTVPLLLVLATGLLASPSRVRSSTLAGRAVTSQISMPASATTPVASSRRSAR
jgi:hypothetical protein